MIFKFNFKAYQLPPPPPPNPPPEDPPPEEPLPLLDGELTIVDVALDIALENDFEKLFIERTFPVEELYQFGGGIFNASNLPAHLSNMPNARA